MGIAEVVEKLQSEYPPASELVDPVILGSVSFPLLIKALLQGVEPQSLVGEYAAYEVYYVVAYHNYDDSHARWLGVVNNPVMELFSVTSSGTGRNGLDATMDKLRPRTSQDKYLLYIMGNLWLQSVGVEAPFS